MGTSTKLTLNLAPPYAEELAHAADRREITQAESIRRMVGVLSVIDTALQEQGDLALAYRDDEGQLVPFHQITETTL